MVLLLPLLLDQPEWDLRARYVCAPWFSFFPSNQILQLCVCFLHVFFFNLKIHDFYFCEKNGSQRKCHDKDFPNQDNNMATTPTCL